MSPRPTAEAPRGNEDLVDIGGIPTVFADRAGMAAIWTGFGAAALGFFVAVVVALAMWIPDAAASGTSGSTVRGGLLAFLAAQHAGLRIDGVHIGFVPLGLTWFAVHLCRRSGRVLWALPSVAGDVGRRRILQLTAVQGVSYAATTTVVSFYAVVGRSSASPAAVGLGSTAVGLVGFGSVALTMTPVGRPGWRQLPASVRVSVKAGLAASCAYLAGGALLAVGSTVLRAGRFLELSRVMGRGLSGLPVAVGDTLAVPNVVLAATSYLAGPGFAVGDNVTYAPFGGHGGLVPAFAVLAGLPVGEHASLTVLALVAVTVLGAGLAAGTVVARGTAGQRGPVALAAAAGSGACAGAVLTVLTALAGGSLGARRLQAVGASPAQVGLAVLVEVSLVSTATVSSMRLFARRAGQQGARDPGEVTRAEVSDGGVSGAEVSGVQVAGVEVSDGAVFDDAVSGNGVSGDAVSSGEVSSGEAPDDHARNDRAQHGGERRESRPAARSPGIAAASRSAAGTRLEANEGDDRQATAS